MKKFLPYILLALLLISTSVYLQMNEPEPLDWSATFSKDDKIPFGTHILFNLLPEVLPGKEIVINKQSPYITLSQPKYKDKNYIIINQYIAPDDAEAKQILELAGSGKNVFIAMENIIGILKDSLKLEMKSKIVFGSDSLQLFLTNENPENLIGKSYSFYTKNASSFFTSYDSARTTVLGYNEAQNPNFIKVRWGSGFIYLHSVPLAFTNYYLVFRDNYEYAFKCLSYLPEAPLIWDEYYKMGEKIKQGTLSYILMQKPLRWAYFILVSTLLFFIVFEGKRKQPIIPVIKPLQNTTLEFTETLGKLYLQNADHKDIATKRINYFYEYLRIKLFLKPEFGNEIFYEKLSMKSGFDKEKIVSLFRFINEVENQSQITENTLLELNGKIDEFYDEVLNRGRIEKKRIAELEN